MALARRAPPPPQGNPWDNDNRAVVLKAWSWEREEFQEDFGWGMVPSEKDIAGLEQMYDPELFSGGDPPSLPLSEDDYRYSSFEHTFQESRGC